jgi:hypothetical protein
MTHLIIFISSIIATCYFENIWFVIITFIFYLIKGGYELEYLDKIIYDQENRIESLERENERLKRNN